MGQGALFKPVVQWWLSLNSSSRIKFRDKAYGTRLRLIRAVYRDHDVWRHLKDFLSCSARPRIGAPPAAAGKGLLLSGSSPSLKTEDVVVTFERAVLDHTFCCQFGVGKHRNVSHGIHPGDGQVTHDWPARNCHIRLGRRLLGLLSLSIAAPQPSS